MDDINGIDAQHTRICRDEPNRGDCDIVDTSAYVTVDTADAVIDWIEDSGRSEPWFAWVAMHAPHRPWSCPPADVFIGGQSNVACATGTPPPTDLDKYQAILQVLDEQLDKILDSTAVDLSDTWIFITSDNGSPGDTVALDPVNTARVKGTIFEGGVRVPFFAAGPDVDEDGSVAEDLFINVSDLYATVLEIGGLSINPRTEDWERNHSQSFMQYLTDPDLSEVGSERVRDCIYTEVFSPNGDSPSMRKQAIAGVVPSGGGDVWKYAEDIGGQSMALYNISANEDPWEATNECGGPSGCSATEQRIISELVACRDAFSEDCTLQDIGEACNFSSDCCLGLLCNPATNTCVAAM